MPPPQVGPDEDGAAPKSPMAGDLDEELTLTEAVVPGLVGRNVREGPGERPSVFADLEVSGCDVGLELVVVHANPRHGQVHRWHGASPYRRAHVCRFLPG